MILCWALVCLAALGACRCCYVLREVYRSRRSGRGGLQRSAYRVLIVLGSGGHTTEMMRLVEGVRGERFGERTYVVATTDEGSLGKAAALEGASGRGGSWEVMRVPRSREVLQSYWSSVATTLRAAAASLVVVWRARPHLVLVNGPGTCVPVAYAAFLLRVLFPHHSSRILFVESACRVRSLSLTALLLWPIADYFLVQWPQLAARLPLVACQGRFI